METLDKVAMRICRYCLMPNHWHFVMSTELDADLVAFLQRLTLTHVTRWQKHRRVVGEGHVSRHDFNGTEQGSYEPLAGP
jgi:REP element-mobilizing transposase RayT